MKVKEIDRTANVSWSPAAHHPIYLAAGTAAQQLDATFSTTAALEIYSLNFSEPGLQMGLKGSLECNHRFYKVAWGCHGMANAEYPSGLIVGGTESGNLLVYDPIKLISGESCEIFQSDKHEGPIYSLDFNLFQMNLLSSGGTDSEIYIWDLNNPEVPVTPGSKSQPGEDVACIAWNKQVQYILASAFPSRCVIWDLRKSEPIIKVAESASRIRYKAIAWHPEVATQLCLASEDDHLPVIQLWDLRFATTPLKSLEHHQRGVLSIAWCPHDPDLLLSCGKDSRILCWNPNSNVQGGQVLCELPTTNQWSFDVTWCPRNPSVIASSSFDGHISVYSLMGNQHQSHSGSKHVVEAFPGSDHFSSTPPASQLLPRHVPHLLQKAPKWLKKPVGASFAFGGKLVHFGHDAGQEQFLVNISQVVTEEEMLKRASEMELSLNNGQLSQFCQKKVQSINNPQDRMLWCFLQASFDSSPRATMLSLLGFNPDEVNQKLSALSSSGTLCAEELSDLSLQDKTGDEFEVIASQEKEAETFFEIKTEESEPDSLLTKALLTGNIEAAVKLCAKEGRWSDALVLAQAGGPDLLASVQKSYLKSAISQSVELISAVVNCNWEHIVKKCELSSWKEALAAVLTYAKPEEFGALCERLGARLERNEIYLGSAMLCYICAGNLEKLANCWLKTNTDPSPASLQDLVEQVVVLKQTVDQASANTVIQSGSLSNLLGKYAEILATQGSLSTAMTYIINISEPSLIMLRDRIACALGLQNPNFSYQKSDARNHVQQPQSTIQQPMHVPTPPQPQLYKPLPVSQSFSSNMGTYQSIPGQVPFSTPSVLQPQAVTNVSAPPVAAETAKKTHHLSHRYPSHVHDPSVYSQPPSYGQPSYNQAMGYTPQTFYSMESSQPSQPASFAPTFQPYVPEAVPPPSPGMPQSSVPPMMLPPGGFLENQSGWNDPPSFKSSKKQRNPSFSQSQPPMTAPIMGAPEPPAPPATNNFYTPFSEQQPFQQSVPPPQVQPPAKPTPEPVKEKGPIPPEHQTLQDTLEDLRQQCQQVASNPQMRRKLDDVARKLENLYDKLRENALSVNTTTGLHQFIQSIQQGDYQTSVLIHSQLVSSGNFSETSGFLPGLKVLVQTAQQLNVYLR